MVLIASCSMLLSDMKFFFRVALLVSCFESSHFFQASQVAGGVTVFGGQEGLHEIPSQSRTGSPSANAKDVHVIVLDSLFRRKMIEDQTGVDTRNLVGADRSADAAAANRHATIHLARDHSPRKWNDKVRIVVVGYQRVRAEVNDLVPG